MYYIVTLCYYYIRLYFSAAGHVTKTTKQQMLPEGSDPVFSKIKADL